MNKLGFISGTVGDARICVLPATVKKLTENFACEIFIEKGMGESLGIHDTQFEEAGATVVGRNDVLHDSEILLFIDAPENEISTLDNKVLIGMLNPLKIRTTIQQFLYRNLTVFSLDMIPRAPRTQSMDVRSSLSTIAGYKAAIKGAELFGSMVPNTHTAGSAIKPAKVLVIGAGVAGMQAIATAKRLGADVEAMDVRKIMAEKVEQLGATFIHLNSTAKNTRYAQAMESDLEGIDTMGEDIISERIRQSDIIITSAGVRGKAAPVIVSAAHVESMAPGSVIVDLASAKGGNCVLTKDEQLIMHGDVMILGAGNLAKQAALASSQMLAENYQAFLEYFLMHHVNANDELLKSCKMIERGMPVHEIFLQSEKDKFSIDELC